MAPQQGDPKRRGQRPPVDPYADLVGPPSSAPSDDPYADLVGPAPVSSRQANDPGGDVDLRDPPHPPTTSRAPVPGADAFAQFRGMQRIMGGEDRPRKAPQKPPSLRAQADATAAPPTARERYHPNVVERAAAQVRDFATETAKHPGHAAKELVLGPVRSLLTSTGGALERGFTDPNADDEHRAIKDKEYTEANAQTIGNTAFGPIEGVVAGRAAGAGVGKVTSKIAGMGVAGAPAGAAYSPDDPAAGALAGMFLGGAFGAAGEGAGRVARATKEAGGAVMRDAHAALSAAEGRRAARKKIAGDAPDVATDNLTPLREFIARHEDYLHGAELRQLLDLLPEGKARIPETMDRLGTADTSLPLTPESIASIGHIVDFDQIRRFSEKHARNNPGDLSHTGLDGLTRAAEAAGVDMTPPNIAGSITPETARARAVEPEPVSTLDQATRAAGAAEWVQRFERDSKSAPKRKRFKNVIDAESMEALLAGDDAALERHLAETHGADHARLLALLDQQQRQLSKYGALRAADLQATIERATGRVHAIHGADPALRGQVSQSAGVGWDAAEREMRPQAPDTSPPRARAVPPHEALARFGPTMYHETSLERAVRLLDPSVMEEASPIYVASVPELALGQGKNTGVHIEFDAAALRGEPNTAKPGLAFTAQQGAGEFIAHNAQRDYQGAVRSITLAPDAGSRGGVWAARARRLFLPALEREGWTKETLADGSVRYSKPGTEPQTALRGTQEPAGATEPASPYADLFGEQGPEKIEQGGLFGEQAGTEGSRPLAAAERAARSELDQLRTRYAGTTDPTARQAIAARMAQLEKLTNRGEKIGAEELGRRAVADGAEADPYGDLTGEPAPKAPRPPAAPDEWFSESAERTDAPSRKSGVVLEDGEKRFEAARSPGGTRRNPERVSTAGLLDELLDLEQKRADAQARAVYEVREDPNFHTSGIPQIVSTKPKGGGASRQAKAMVNLDAFARAQAEIEAALAKRGIEGDVLTELVQEHFAEREERRALAGDFDPGNLNRGQVTSDAGDVLFSQTPDAFKGEPPTHASGVEIAQARAEQGGTSPVAKLSAPRRALVVATVKANAFKDAAQRVFAPASRSADAGRIALAIREHGGDFARRNEQARESFKDLAGTFDRMPETERLDFIDRIETGQPQPNPTLQKAADLMRRLLDDGRDTIRALGTGKLEHWIQNYFPHLWEDESAAVTFIDRVMSKRSLSGPGTFLKRRSIPTLHEGIEAGLEPLTTNPVDMTLLKLREMNKYLAGQRILAEMKEMGFAKFVSALEKAPEGLVKLDDKLGTVYGPPEVQVTEGFDKLVREKLTSVIEELGVTHTRKANIGGHARMGFAEGDKRITTKAGGPDTVIEHELGHVLDAKLGVWDRLTDIPGKTREAIDARKQLHAELRALADMRYEGMDPGGLPKAFKDYVRKKEEKIANAIHALVYLPDRMEDVAPMVKARLTTILQGHPVAAKLLDVKPSLVLGTSEYGVPAGGLVVRGHWYVPEPVARVVNNHLSPGLQGNPFYDLYRGVGNSMNQWQLGFSAFHLGFTSMDAAVSKTALGIEQMANGQPLAGLRSMAETPVAPVSNYLRGSKVLREYLTPGTEGGEMAAIIDALVQGGGRVRMDEFYGGGAIKQFREALTRGKKLRAGRLTLGAIAEASSHLVMAHIVPRQKLGVFADLARFELSKLPENATKDEVRAAMAHAWDSVDNRMGQVVYDNLFWHRAAKDLTMASVRSVGWNLGTIRELGGGIADLQAVPRRVTHRAFKGAGLPGDWQGANEPVGLTHRAAYVMALPMTVGMAGAIVNYLYTGEPPRELKDYYYPRTGRKNPDGTDERVQLPSYIRDVGDYSRHPVQTLVNKMHPLSGAIRDMLQNEDYYGHQIHNPDDPMVRQAQQEALYIIQQFEPFGLHNAREQWARGQKGAAFLNSIGITPAPREVTRTPADLRMSQELGRRASGHLTPEEVDRQHERRSALDALRARTPNAPGKVGEALSSGALKPRDLKSTMRDAATSPDVLRFQHLSLAEAMRVYQLATPEEKARFGPVLFKKLQRARQQGAPIPSMQHAP